MGPEGKTKKDRTKSAISFLQHSISKDLFSRPPKLHRQGHEYSLNCLLSICVKMKRGPVKYVLEIHFTVDI